MQDVQGLADGAALHTELLGQLGLGGHALPGAQCAGSDPAAQLVGDLPMGRAGRAGFPDGGVLRIHGKTLQLPANLRQFSDSWL